MLLADRPTTSRWAPPSGQTLLIKSGRSSKARTEVDTSSARPPSPGSQIALEPDLGSAFDPTRTVARAGTADSTPGSLRRFTPPAPDARLQRQAGVRHLGRGRRRPPGVADVCFLRMRSSACRCRLDCGGSRLRPGASVEGGLCNRVRGAARGWRKRAKQGAVLVVWHDRSPSMPTASCRSPRRLVYFGSP